MCIHCVCVRVCLCVFLLLVMATSEIVVIFILENSQRLFFQFILLIDDF